VDSQKNPK